MRIVSVFAVKKEEQSRGGSRSLHEEVSIGTELSIGAPRTVPELNESSGQQYPDRRGHRHHAVAVDGVSARWHAARASRCTTCARSEAHAAFMTLLTRAPSRLGT